MIKGLTILVKGIPMLIAALKEGKGEARVAITPSTVKNYCKMGFKVGIEKEAGVGSGYSDKAYQDQGAEIFADRKELLAKTQLLLCVNEPLLADVKKLPEKTLIITPTDLQEDSDLVQMCLKNNLSLFSMTLIPRISRAQSMDILSSQANLAGYKAVLEGINHFKKAVPMMMTAAGMIHPAKVLILGAGVAGLQAIATAKRIGAVVYAFDVRRAAKEQVESLGAEFVEVNADLDAETQGGYAKETSDEYKQQQAELIDQYAKMADIVVSTALIPGRPAPVLIQKATVEAMKPGSVIVDIATAKGGNCAVSEKDKIVEYHGVTIVGLSNLPGLIPGTASDLFANNIYQLLRILSTQADEISFNAQDEIIQQALLCQDGRYLPYQPAKETAHV